MVSSLRFVVIIAVFAIVFAPTPSARASCIDPTSCLCDLQRDDGIAALAVTVVAVANGVTQVRIDDVSPFPGQTTAVTEGDVRDVEASEETVGERYLAILRHCVSCEGCRDYECHGCELCINGIDRLTLSRKAGTDGISCAYDGEKVWIALPIAVNMSVSSSCRSQVSTRLEDEGADLDCHDTGFFFCHAGAARGDSHGGFMLVALVTAGLVRRRVVGRLRRARQLES